MRGTSLKASQFRSWPKLSHPQRTTRAVSKLRDELTTLAGAEKTDVSEAWKTARFAAQCESLVNYYTTEKVPLFQYHGYASRPTRMPLYVAEEWADPSRPLRITHVFANENPD